MGSLTQYYGSSRGGSSNGTQQKADPANKISPSQSSSNVGLDLSPAVSSVASNTVGYGLSQSPTTSVPGLTGLIGGAANTAMQGGSKTQVAQSGVRGALTEAINRAVPSLPGLGSVIGAAASEMLSPDPQPAVAATKSVLSSLGALLGSPLGVLGSMAGAELAGYLGNKSLEGGYLGDALDSRTRESERDAVERDLGQSQSSTRGMEAADRMGIDPRADGYGFGLSSNYGATTQGVMSKSFNDGWGVQSKTKTLSDYYGERVKELSTEEKTIQEAISEKATDGSYGGYSQGNGDGTGLGGYGDSAEGSAGGPGNRGLGRGGSEGSWA